MNKELIIIGDGYQARLIQSILNEKKIKLTGFYIFRKKNLLKKNKKYKFFKKISEIKKIQHKNLYLTVAVGDNILRKNIVDKFNKKLKKIRWYKIISENALVSKNVSIGAGTTIMPSSIINHNTRIGKHCIINTRSLIEHDNVFANFSSTGPGVITGGNVKVGKMSFIGIGSVVKNNIKIGYNSLIGAKSLIIKNCKPKSTYYGSPAKKK